MICTMCRRAGRLQTEWEKSASPLRPERKIHLKELHRACDDRCDCQHKVVK